MRPRHTIALWAFELISIAALISACAFTAIYWAELPPQMPTHFGISGRPDRWGGKGSIVFLLVVDIASYVLLTAAARYQRLINLPIKVDRDSPVVRQLLLGMTVVLKAVLMLLFLWLMLAEIRTGLGEANGLGKAFLPVFLVAVFGVLIFYTLMLRKQNHSGRAA